MKDSKLIDSSVWIAYLTKGDYSNIIDSENLLLMSVLSLFEIKKKLVKSKIASSDIAKSMDFIKKRSFVIPLTAEIAEKAVDVSIEHGMSAIDSLIYATSILNDSVVVTFDNDFRGLKGAVVV